MSTFMLKGKIIISIVRWAAKTYNLIIFRKEILGLLQMPWGNAIFIRTGVSFIHATFTQHQFKL